MTTTKVSAKLAKLIETHLPPDTTSSRAIQRAAALWIGHADGKIEPAALRGLCEALNLFDYEGRSGENNFGANFTQNMKKDIAYFDGDHTAGWKLTAAGKAEAKSIFEDGNPPTRRRVGDGKPKAPKKAKAAKAAKPAAAVKKPAKPAKAPKAAKPAKAPKAPKEKKATPAPTPAPAGDAERKAAAKRRALAKKRDLSTAPSPAPATEPASATAPSA